MVIVDATYLCWRSFFSVNKLSYDEFSTGVIFGFLRDVLFLSKELKDNKFVFAWDGKGSLRKVRYPEYKGNRHKVESELTPDEIKIKNIFFKQLEALRDEVLPKIGFKNVFSQRGIEADDIIAKVAIQEFRITGKKPVVISSDADLFQLLKWCHIYSIKDKEYYTEVDFEADYGIEPPVWALVKAIAGCTSDNVKGLPGVGEKTAIKYLRQEIYEGKKFFTIVNGDKIIQRNLELVKLPHARTADFEIANDEKFYQINFMGVCQKYNFISFLKTDGLKPWKKNFNME